MTASSPTPPPAGHLPGRLIDVVHAAVRALGLLVFSVTVQCGTDGAVSVVRLQLAGSTDERTARAVFAALGVADPVLGEPYGSQPQANLDGPVPALDLPRLSVLVTELPARPAAGDVVALVADVDARRSLAAAVTA